MRDNKYRTSGSILACLAVLTAATFSNACDTWVALPEATDDNTVILAKNSDRSLFDCQPLVYNPRQTWPAGSEINLGRLTIPQVAETYATLGSSPYWCWGYEEGINEFGVTIGNEGIYTRVLAGEIAAHRDGAGPQPGPTGMDLLRLGLERGATAREALDAMTDLLESYGQFGSGLPTYGVDGAYHNSFIIADPKEAWILETAGRRWIARRVSRGVASISNSVSIGTIWDLASPDLIDHAVANGWWPGDKIDAFDFASAYNDDSPAARARSQRAFVRADRSRELLEDEAGDIDARWMMRIARDRDSSPGIDMDQTASSCVAVLPNTAGDLPVFWWCPAVPSRSCYVPFFVHGNGPPAIVSTAGSVGKIVAPPSTVEVDGFSENSYWWIFRDLCDLVSAGPESYAEELREIFDDLEDEFADGLEDVMNEAVRLRKAGRTDEAAQVLDGFTAACVARAFRTANDLRARFAAENEKNSSDFEPYLGPYSAPRLKLEAEVLEMGGFMAVRIPNQGIFKLKPPDDEGKWYFIQGDMLAFSFDRNDSGRVTTMSLHQKTAIPRTDTGTVQAAAGLPAELAPYLGTFGLPLPNAIFTVLVQDGHLAVDVPDGDIIELKPPDENGWWYFSEGGFAVSFDRDDSGRVNTLNLHQTFGLRKGKSAVMAVDRAITEAGIAEAVEQYYDLKYNHSDEYYFSEKEFNDLGYMLLGGARTAEAIEIFKLNVEAHPESWNAHDSMAEAYMTNGDRDLAIAYYKKSLALNPDNANGRKILEKLESDSPGR